MDVLVVLQVDEVVDSEHYQELVRNDEEQLAVLNDVAVRVNGWNDCVEPYLLLGEALLVDYHEVLVDDGKVLVVKLDLAFLVNSSRRSNTNFVDVQLL